MKYEKLFTLAAMLAPSVAVAADLPEHRVRGDLAIRARHIFQKHCAECHTGRPEPGFSKLNLMDREQVVARKTPVPLATANGRSLILDLVKDGSMPPANRPAPSAEEVAVLEKWVSEKAPSYPVAFDERYVLEAVTEHMELTEKKGFGVNFFRYVSFAHLVRDGAPLPDLAAAERLLQTAFAAATTPAVDFALKLEPVDAAGTVHRIGLNPAGWAERRLFVKMDGLKEAGASDLQPFDLILLEYPFASRLPADDALRPRLNRLFAKPFQGRPVPFVRGDWLAAALSEGRTPTPLGVDLNSLTALGRALTNAALPAPDGPDAKPFAGAQPVSVPAGGGRAALPPLSAWYAGDVAPEKPPFALKAELVVADKPVTRVKVDEAFHLRVTSDRKVHFALLMVQADGEIRVQPVMGGTVLLANTPRLLAPKATGLVIGGIAGGGDAATEHFILFASETELPVPTILRSKHGDKHVWRFLMEPTEKDKFDPNAVVRKVIPIKVVRE